ncbi:hypothetical protein BN1708_010005 [Verticillium longisporum]|uniref:Uncharacterized protein n=1 Tax=Verticillium longisporum TaxID=100787 RepID=A0A0G4KMZ2_VERLO|nr:hypothetical protein BN1708_010005 [Verticillium longisporum]
MVSFLGKVSEKARLIERDLRAAATKPPADNTEVPPAYSAEPRNDAAPSAIAVDLAPALGELNLSGTAAARPTPDACLAHLRLLFAFQVLKNEVGYTDGLWEIWDERAKGSAQVLAALREKRWALYVARAVDRYGAWWQSFVPDMLLEADLVTPGVVGRTSRYVGFVQEAKPMKWTEEMLPPLDVLMVWHAQMLNPRLYFEDCLRYGHDSIWAGGMPWDVVNKAIDGQFNWISTGDRLANWTARTDAAWKNQDDTDIKELRCPACPATVQIPWTTCGLPKGYSGTSRPGIAGSGYGDGQLENSCNACNFVVTHDSLRVTKLLKDIQNATKSGTAMPGTILDLKTGVPAMIKNDEKDEHDRLFPSRLACRGLLIEVLGMMDPKNDKISTMLAVKDIVETFTESHRIQIELGGKAADKKNDVKLNWLHLPTAEQSMLKNVTKYERFFDIMAANPGEAAVPTLDVDLAWHTHQLSPKAYYEYSVSTTRNFVDHNDKVDEEKLGVSFEWTSKMYEKKYNEVYAECRCWYCETVRMQSIPKIAKMFASSKEEKFLESYHASGNSSKHPLPPSTPSAHISTHNAVHTVETKSRSATTRMQRMLFRNAIDEYEVKARKKATRPLPTGEPRMGQREDTALKWGVRVPLAGPWVSIAAATTTAAMYATPPGEVYTGPGSVGSCASGTCGGHSGCGSETLGMCSAGCVGSGWFGGGAGCTGFGGGI